MGIPCRYTESVELARPEPALPPTERGKLEQEFVDAIQPVAFKEEAPAAAAPGYRALSVFECQCLAAGASTLANLLDQERWTPPTCPRLNQVCHKRQTQMRDALLFYTALEARNRQAGGALEVYYRIAEGEARIELVQETLTFLDEALAKTKDLVRQGIAGQQDYESVLRQRIEFATHLVELKLAVDTLNAELKQLLGMSPAAGTVNCADGTMALADAENWRIRPTLEGDLPPRRLEAREAIQTALSYRPELGLLDFVATNLDLATLPVVRELLKSFNALLVKQPSRGQALVLVVKLLKGTLQEEVSSARSKILSQLRERERQVMKEVTQAVAEANARAELAQLARQQVESRLNTVKDLEEKSRRGIVGFQTLTEARLSWLKARGEAIVAVSKWHMALSRVRQAQGVLALECGFGLAEESCPLPAAEAPTEVQEPETHDS
ncbi:MAG: hypothetical protein AB7K24_33075, partial [Gemmataceae bacterium]